MAETHLISGLKAKRGELAGELAALETRRSVLYDDISKMDHVLRLCGYAGSPENIPPRVYQPNRMFERCELQRMVLDIRREAGGVMSNRNIAAQIIRLKNWDESNPTLLKMMTLKVKDVTKRYPVKGG